MTYVAYPSSAVATFWHVCLLFSSISWYLRNRHTQPLIRCHAQVLAPLLPCPVFCPLASTLYVAEVPNDRPFLDACHFLLDARLATPVAVPLHNYAAHVLGFPVLHVLRNEYWHFLEVSRKLSFLILLF